MENSKILLYVLHGSWNNEAADGVEVLGVSEDIEQLVGKLEDIAENKAMDYIEINGNAEEDRGERYFEIIGQLGGYAKFYITEHSVEISESLMGRISRDMEKIDRARDIGEYIFGLYETGGIEAWKYEYMNNNAAVMEEMIRLFSKTEDCNTAYNATMENVVEQTIKNISMNDSVLEFLWQRLGDITVDDDGCILADFMDYKVGTDREEIWHWFDEHYSKGVAYLMYGEGCRKKICKRCGAEVQEEKDAELAKEYPYYCPNCDENMYSFECREV